MRRLSILACVLWCCLLLGPVARAERSPYVERVFQQGQSRLRLDDLPGALEQFKRCLFMVEGDDDETFRMMLLVAVVYEKMGDLPHAIELYRRFLTVTGRAYPSVELFWDDRRHEVEYTLGVVEARARAELALLSIVSEPAGAAVIIGGRQAGADSNVVSPTEIFVKPGRRLVELKVGGVSIGRQVVHAVAGARHELRFGGAE